MPSLLEALAVYALVVLCAAYCLWIFLPAGLKQRGARALMAHSGRLQASRTLQALAQPAAGCASGCSGCGSEAAAPAQAARVHHIRWARKPAPPPG
ncbi:hypothetical protein [Polaromonas sp.]|uniref:hypothetical protein n=1 Tax=Polaromonas sp. TaxID=1869339 RepID=UPI00272FF951|nr:hypothetical protein [Polaromonas sp.]MDP1885059.1 hypothetical protein [Polaromonas sp.]